MQDFTRAILVLSYKYLQKIKASFVKNILHYMEEKRKILQAFIP